MQMYTEKITQQSEFAMQGKLIDMRTLETVTSNGFCCWGGLYFSFWYYPGSPKGKAFFVLNPTFVSRISIMSIWELTVGEMMWHANDIFIKKYFNENRNQKGQKNPAGSDGLLTTRKYKYLLGSAAVASTSYFYIIIFKEMPKFLVMAHKSCRA